MEGHPQKIFDLLKPDKKTARTAKIFAVSIPVITVALIAVGIYNLFKIIPGWALYLGIGVYLVWILIFVAISKKNSNFYNPECRNLLVEYLKNNQLYTRDAIKLLITIFRAPPEDEDELRLRVNATWLPLILFTIFLTRSVETGNAELALLLILIGIYGILLDQMFKSMQMLYAYQSPRHSEIAKMLENELLDILAQKKR